MSLLSMNAKLDRTDSSTPWGFRLHGGVDYHSPLSIQRITPGSLASKCGLLVGDAIVKIGDSPTQGMRHKDAMNKIMTQGNSLELTLQRGGALLSASDSYGSYGADQVSRPPPLGLSPVPGVPPDQYGNYNRAAQPFHGSGGPPSVPVSNYGVSSLTAQTRNMALGPPGEGMSENDTSNGLSNQLNGLSHEVSPVPSKPTNKPVFKPANNRDLAKKATASFPSESDSSATSPLGFQPIERQSPTIVTEPRRIPAKELSHSPNSAFTATSAMSYKQENIPKPVSPTYAKPDVQDTPRYSPGSYTPNADNKRSIQVTPTMRAVQELSNEKPNMKSSRGTPPERKISTGSTSQAQSRAFKMLQSKLDAGEDVTALGGGGRRLSGPSQQKQEKDKGDRVKAVVNAQYNSPIAIYSKGNMGEVLATKAVQLKQEIEREDGEDRPPGTLPPTHTMALVMQEDAAYKPGDPDTPTVAHARSFQQKPSLMATTRSGPAAQPAPFSPSRGAPISRPAAAPMPAARAPAPSSGGSWAPKVPTGPRTMRAARAGEAKSMGPVGVGVRVPICSNCGVSIRGPFVLALDKSWCPDHFHCSNPHCRANLIGIGFVEEEGQLFCEKDYEQYFAPRCHKCGRAIMRECVNAMKETFHPECFLCVQCGCQVGQGAFHLEDGKTYCEKDWQAMFQTKCYGCQFPIEPGDRWVEALNENWHSECFNCSTCQVNLEGQPFYAKGGRPYCKKHAMGSRF